MDGLTEIGQIIGPIGVLVVVVAWALISRRNGNGQYQVVVAKLDALRYDMTEIKSDVRKLRASLVRHLEDHAH
jgi:hypothetical protein